VPEIKDTLRVAADTALKSSNYPQINENLIKQKITRLPLKITNQSKNH